MNLGVEDDRRAERARLCRDSPRASPTIAAFMADVRAAIRDGIAHSPLTDMVQHTRHLEAAYVAALQARCPDALSAARSADV